MKKRVLPLLLTLLLLLALTAVPVSAGYVPRYGDAAEVLWEMGLFQGNGTSFALDKSLDRASGVTMLVRVLGKDAEAKAGSWTTPFTDVPDWAVPYVGYAYEKGLTTGTGATTFSPGDGMNAKQFLTLMLRALGYDDKAGDFSYLEAEKKALDIGLIDQSCYEEYTAADDFRRDDAAKISAVALWLNKKGTDTLLKDTITVPGRPAGDVPALTDDLAASAGQSAPAVDPKYTPYALYLNGVLQSGVSAYAEEPWTTVLVPVEYIASAAGRATVYDPAADGGKLTVKASSTSSYSYSVNGNSLKFINAVAYIDDLGGVWDAMGVTLERDKDAKALYVSGQLSQPSPNWSSVGRPGGSGQTGGAAAPSTPTGGSGNTGWSACTACGGRGSTTCPSCGGMGQRTTTTMTRDPFTGTMIPTTGWTTCAACGGRGNNLCHVCNGTGHQ